MSARKAPEGKCPIEDTRLLFGFHSTGPSHPGPVCASHPFGRFASEDRRKEEAHVENKKSFSDPRTESGTERATRPPGRPAIHGEDWSKVTVVMLNRQVIFLDRLSADIRAATGSIVKRAEIIRTLVDLLAESDVNVGDARPGNELKEILRNSLGRLMREEAVALS